MDKIRTRVNRPRWFEHVMRRQESKAVRVVMKLTLNGKEDEENFNFYMRYEFFFLIVNFTQS